jgi:restriction system protein
MVQRLVYKKYLAYDHADDDVGEIDFGHAMLQGKCPFCKARFKQFTYNPCYDSSITKYEDTLRRRLHLCKQCGWWQLNLEGESFFNGQKQEFKWWELYHAILVHIDISSNNVPIEDLRTNLVRRWDDRKYITAQKAEELVSGILKDYYAGCSVHHMTANTNAADGGIDLYLVEDNGEIHSAVQVKRRVKREVESVKEVRDFVGALLLEGYDKGVFVTTASRFSPSAQNIPKNSNLKNHKIELELINGERLLDLLKHSISSSPLNLPVSVSPNSLWKGEDGNEFSIINLLFSNDCDLLI